MDDPLIPDDEERLAVTLAEQLLHASNSPSREMTDVTTWADESPGDQPVRPSRSRATARGTNKPAEKNPVPTPYSKTQNANSRSSVKKQIASDTKSVERHPAPSAPTVKRQKAPAKPVTKQDAPVLTLTSNFNYKNFEIPLTLNKKRDIRAALKPLVEFAASTLDDEHSTGMFYVTATQLYPDNLQVFVDALESARKQGIKQGRRRESVNMGAAFVKAVRDFTAAEGVPFQLGESPERAQAPEPPAEEEVAPSPVVSSRRTKSPVREGERAESRRVPGTRLTTKQLWTSLLEELRSKTSKASYEMWLRNCYIASVDADSVVIATPSAFAREFVNDRLLSIIRRAVKQLVGREMEVYCESQPVAAGSRKKSE